MEDIIRHKTSIKLDIRHQLNRTRHSRKNAKIRPTAANANRLEREENYLHQLMSTSKTNYEASMVEEFAYSNSSKIYKYINNLLKRDNLPEIMHLESQLASCDMDKASLFNKSVYTTSETGQWRIQRRVHGVLTPLTPPPFEVIFIRIS